MKYSIKKENKSTLTTCGKYKAVAVHQQTVENKQICEEIAEKLGINNVDVDSILTTMATVVSEHLRKGDIVRLKNLGLMKLEIKSEKVDNPKDFNAKKHISGVSLHVIPQSTNGVQPLYDDIQFEKDKTKG